MLQGLNPAAAALVQDWPTLSPDQLATLAAIVDHPAADTPAAAA